MREVLLALLPGVVLSGFFLGIGVWINLLLSIGGCLAVEAIALRLRRHRLQAFLTDGSAVVTGVLIALALPPQAPWWLALAGAACAMLLGKHLYGGLGHNPFNPAMLAVAALLASFPAEMSRWTTDAVSSATTLEHVRTQLSAQRTLAEIGSDALNDRGAAWIALAWLAGGVYLLWRRVIRWQIPLSMLGALTFAALLFWGIDSDRHASPLFHWLHGATLLGAFFIATDPVSAATTPRGRLIYGAGIGLLIYGIRSAGVYADGLAFAVLLMNLLAPTIDRYTPPRDYGRLPS